MKTFGDAVALGEAPHAGDGLKPAFKRSGEILEARKLACSVFLPAPYFGGEAIQGYL